jgi:competence transcription factor ComK
MGNKLQFEISSKAFESQLENTSTCAMKSQHTITPISQRRDFVMLAAIGPVAARSATVTFAGSNELRRSAVPVSANGTMKSNTIGHCPSP